MKKQQPLPPPTSSFFIRTSNFELLKSLSTLSVFLITIAFPIAAQTRPFHLQIRTTTALSSPLLQRFGTISVDLYPHGFRIKTIWLRGFSRNGTGRMTTENPITRTYVETPMSDVGRMILNLGGHPLKAGPPKRVEVTTGSVAHIAARRFRLHYDGDDYVDIWTTSAYPAPAFRAFIDEFVRTLYPQSVATFRAIPGTPIYVALNMGKYDNTPVVWVNNTAFRSSEEATALRVGPWMFPAPFGTIFQ